MKLEIIIGILLFFLCTGCYRSQSGSDDQSTESGSTDTGDTEVLCCLDETDADTADSETMSDSSHTSHPMDSDSDSQGDTQTESDMDTDSHTQDTSETDSQTDEDTASSTDTDSDAAVDCAGKAVWYDSATSLCWEIVPGNSDLAYSDAYDYCENATTGGYNDWKLPNVEQLRTLILGCPETETGGPCQDYPEIIEACYGCGIKDDTDENRCYWNELFGSQCTGRFWTTTRSYYERNTVIDFEEAFISRDWPGDPDPDTDPGRRAGDRGDRGGAPARLEL